MCTTLLVARYFRTTEQRKGFRKLEALLEILVEKGFDFNAEVDLKLPGKKKNQRCYYMSSGMMEELESRDISGLAVRKGEWCYYKNVNFLLLLLRDPS